MVWYAGRGLLVLVAFIISAGVALPFMNDAADANDQWKLGLGLILGAVLNFIWGRGLEWREHHFSFVPLPIWGLIFGGGGIALIVSSFV